MRVVALEDYENQDMLKLYPKSWWYMMSSRKRVPGMFIGGGRGGRLLIDLDVFEKWLESKRRDEG